MKFETLPDSKEHEWCDGMGVVVGYQCAWNKVNGIFIILIVLCTNVIVSSGNPSIIPSVGREVYNAPL